MMGVMKMPSNEGCKSDENDEKVEKVEKVWTFGIQYPDFGIEF